MKCKQIQKFIWLYPRDITPDEQRQVEIHAEQCRECRQEFSARKEQIRVINTVKVEPALKQPQLFTLDVMRAVRRMPNRLLPFSEGFIDRLLTFFGLRAVRLTFSGLILAMVLFFAVHETMLMRRIERLEQQVAQHKSRDLPPNWEKASAELLSRFDADQLPPINEASRQELLDFIDLIRKNPLLFKVVEQQARIYLQDGLNPDELNRLLTLKAVQEKFKSL